MRRLASVAAALLIVGAGLVPAPAQAAMPRPRDTGFDCTSTGGVWVVVEGQGAGCAHGASTGVDALRQAGFAVQAKRNGLICKIGTLDKCAVSWKTGDPYWFYFHKAPGSTEWTFSDEGAATYAPAPGSVEGWKWGTGMRPYDPPAYGGPFAPAPAPAPAPDTAPAPAPAPAPNNEAPAPAPAPKNAPAPGNADAIPASETQPVPSIAPTTAASPHTEPSPSSTSAPAAPTTTRPSTIADTPTMPASVEGNSEQPPTKGSPLPTILTLGFLALAALCGGGWWLLKGRKH